jgi:hypothetical protein
MSSPAFSHRTNFPESRLQNARDITIREVISASRGSVEKGEKSGRKCREHDGDEREKDRL